MVLEAWVLEETDTRYRHLTMGFLVTQHLTERNHFKLDSNCLVLLSPPFPLFRYYLELSLHRFSTAPLSKSPMLSVNNVRIPFPFNYMRPVARLARGDPEDFTGVTIEMTVLPRKVGPRVVVELLSQALSSWPQGGLETG